MKTYCLSIRAPLPRSRTVRTGLAAVQVALAVALTLPALASCGAANNPPANDQTTVTIEKPSASAAPPPAASAAPGK
jgi:hypothetical protein